jgi:hypothetical protein
MEGMGGGMAEVLVALIRRRAGVVGTGRSRAVAIGRINSVAGVAVTTANPRAAAATARSRAVVLVKTLKAGALSKGSRAVVATAIARSSRGTATGRVAKATTFARSGIRHLLGGWSNSAGMSSSARRRMRLGVVPRNRVVAVHLRLRSRGSPGENLVRGAILAGV